MKNRIIIFLFFTLLLFFFMPNVCMFTHLPITPGPGGSDITDLNLPYKHLLSEKIREFEIPLWSNLIWCGYPLHAEGQGGFLYPLNIFLFSIFPYDVGFNLSIILNFFLCCFFTYLFYRENGLKWQTAAVSAAVFSFSGFFFCHIQHLNMLNTVAWFPLIFYLVEKFHKTGRYGYIIGAGLAFGIQILAGFPQFAYYTGIFIFVSFCVNAKPSVRQGGYIRLFAGMAIFAAVGMAVSAAQWMPTLELVSFTARKSGFAQDPARWWWAYKFDDLVMWFFPYKYGMPYNNTFHKFQSIFSENSFFFSKTALIAGIAGFVIFFRRDFFLPSVAGISFVFAMSPALGLTGILDKVPGVENFRLHQRALVFAVFSLVFYFGAVCEKIPKKYNVLKYMVFLAVFYELFIFAGYQNAYYPAKEWRKLPESAKALKEDKSNFRVWAINSFSHVFNGARGFSGDLSGYCNYRNVLQPNSNIMSSVAAIEGHGGLRPKRFYEIWDKISAEGLTEKTFRFIGFAGGKYIMSQYDLNAGFLKLLNHYELSKDLPPIKVYRNEFFKNRVFYVNSSIVLDEKQIVESMFFGGFNPENTLILEKQPKQLSYKGKGNAAIIKYTDTEAIVETSSENGGFLLLTDT